MEGRGRVPLSGRASTRTYRELLATRVLSVDAYWEELRDPRRRPPNECEIPVPLWPGESQQQYEREFCRWLASRRLSLTSMREDPVTERKCRLQFAQTRVARPQRAREGEAGQRAPSQLIPRSRSRSRSRSMSPQRRFNGMQQPPPQRSYPVRREDNRTHPPSFERRASLDSGRLFASRQQGDREQHDRSYSRERPHSARHADPSEAPRTYDNRQNALHSDPRRRQDSRAPSPHNVPRQYVGDVQRWNKSPSRSPRYSTASSPPRSDMPPSQVRRSASPQLFDSFRKQLLARRVISLEAFRDEMYRLRHGFIHEDDLKRPHETMVRIPVILWPGESMAQYSQKFERWLDSRNNPLALLRDNPAKERSLWHSFAYTRAGTSDFAEPARPSARSRSPSRVSSRSRSRSSSRSVRRSSERGRPPMSSTYVEDIPVTKEFAPTYSPEQLQRPKSPPSTIAPPENPHLFDGKNRTELLGKRIVPLDVFQKEVNQNLGVGFAKITEGNILPAIPVPLHPGESMGLYSHRFWTWLQKYNETNESLRSNPARERRFRMAFAYLRVNKPQAPAITGDRIAGAQKAHGFRSSVETHAKIPLGVLKSARARLAMNAKRLADDSEHNEQPQSLREEPDSKRARVDVEGKTRAQGMPGIPSSRLSAITEQKHSTTTPAMTSSQRMPSRLTLAPAPTTTSARPLASMVTVTADSVRSVRPSMPAQATSASVRVEVRTSHSLVPPVQRRPITIIPKSVTPQTETATSRSLVARVQNTTVVSKSANTTVGGSAPLRSSTVPLQKIMPRLGKTVVEPTTSQSSTIPLQKIKPRPERTASSTGKPVDPQAAPRSLLVTWNKHGSESASSTPSSGPVAKSAPPSLSSSSSAPPAVEPPKVSSAEKPRESPTPAGPSAAGAPSRSSPSVERPTATIVPSTANAGTDAIENDGADTDAAQSEPDTNPAESAVCKMSDADSNPADDGEVHDGDVMNPDGCCCTKCMRSWAWTLTDRMDQLEQNVQDLKREVVTQTGDQATTAR